MGPAPLLSAHQLDVRYGTASALRGVSLTLPARAIVGVTGNNGAGKSTLLHTLMGLVRPSRGSISLRSDTVTGFTARKMVARGVALVPEGRHLFGDQTVRDNLRLGYRQESGGSFAAAVADVLQIFPDLQGHLGRPAGALSGGQQQMVAVARALVARPSLLLLDEPFLGLAPILVARLMDQIRELPSTGITVLIAEAAAMRLVSFCDYTYILRLGEIVAAGERSALPGPEELHRLLLGS